MADSFLGRGWRFMLGEGPAVGLGLEGGRVAEVSRDELIRQSIWLILSTAPGERVARPDFGCGIHNLVFGSESPEMLGDVGRAVEEALSRFEPRIDVLGVEAQPHASEPNLLIIQVRYAVRTTNSRFNLVYPFYVS
ncbi:GPW/gp25 family protein [Pyxidicoccus sp. 3LG]